MKKLVASVLMASFAMVLMTGCAGLSTIVGGTAAGIYTNVQGPVAVGSAGSSQKVGEASSTAIVFFATGDASIQTAMQNGGITKVHHVDHKSMGILGLYAKYTTVVYGE
jgi:hypothetical protein